jgi:hypothetical protein
MIIGYLTDGIFFGKSSNIAGLPYAFQKLETGGFGAVGQKAFCSWLDSQFFVGPTDIYNISASGGVTPIGTVIAKQSVMHPDCKPNYVQIVADPDRQKILFGFAFGSSKQINKLFIYNLKTQAWSYENTESTNFVSVSTHSLSTRWSDFANDHITGEWDQQTIRWFQGSQISYTNYLFTQRADGYLYIYNENSSYDQLSDGTKVPVQVWFETGDFDFDNPDLIKTVTRLSLKLSDPYTRLDPIVIDVFGSTTRGRTWKNLGQMRILGVPDDEDAINFRLTGSLVRFRFKTTSLTVPYEVTEWVMRVTGRGLDSQRRGTND